MARASHNRRLEVLAQHLRTPAGPEADLGGAGADASGTGDEGSGPLLISELTRALAPDGMLPSFPHATSAHRFPDAAHDALDLKSLLSHQERDLQRRVRQLMEAEVAPVITKYWEKAEFPHHLVPKLAALKLGIGTMKGFGNPDLGVVANAMAVVEMARVDASMATFHLVHAFLAALTIGLLGSEEQKAKYLPAMADYTMVGCWGLTEASNGSDASALTTTACKVPGGWKLNGQKRWIGNGTWADVNVVWARNTDTKQVNAFIVEKGAQGFKADKIQNKIALRCVQNADMYFHDCFVPDSARLPGVNSFQDTNKVLAVSRIMVAWLPVGMCMGVYDMCLRYLKERQQFGTPLASFQLAQERLGRILANTQAMFLMALQLSRLSEQGKVNHEQASLVKAWNTLRGRECVALARELLGGNGIVTDFHVAKVFCDMEAIYTYEGTYDVNMLVLGRGLTGISAFKASKRQ